MTTTTTKFATYKEPVYQYRVLRQLNDPVRNPSGEWTLVYSSPVYEDAEAVWESQSKLWKRTGDVHKIVDSGVEVEYFERICW